MLGGKCQRRRVGRNQVSDIGDGVLGHGVDEVGYGAVRGDVKPGDFSFIPSLVGWLEARSVPLWVGVGDGIVFVGDRVGDVGDGVMGNGIGSVIPRRSDWARSAQNTPQGSRLTSSNPC